MIRGTGQSVVTRGLPYGGLATITRGMAVGVPVPADGCRVVPRVLVTKGLLASPDYGQARALVTKGVVGCPVQITIVPPAPVPTPSPRGGSSGRRPQPVALEKIFVAPFKVVKIWASVDGEMKYEYLVVPKGAAMVTSKVEVEELLLPAIGVSAWIPED